MSDSSFKSVLTRLDRSLTRQQGIARDLKAQKALIAPRIGELAMAALDRRLTAHLERVEKSLEALQFERSAVIDLIEKSPELPLAGGSGKSSGAGKR